MLPHVCAAIMRRASGASSPQDAGFFGAQVRPGVGAAGLEAGGALDPEIGSSSSYTSGGQDMGSIKKVL